MAEASGAFGGVATVGHGGIACAPVEILDDREHDQIADSDERQAEQQRRDGQGEEHEFQRCERGIPARDGFELGIDHRGAKDRERGEGGGDPAKEG